MHINMSNENVMTPGRMSARTMLRERIERLQRQVKQLEALDKALPLELPQDADEALWEMLLRSRD